MKERTDETALCSECETFVPRTKIISWTDMENDIGVCWECYGDD